MSGEIDYDKVWRRLSESLEQLLQGLVDAAAERARRRDTFAAAALTGLVSLNAPGPHQRMPDEIIQSAWRWADAMLDAGDATAGPTSVSVPPSPATRPGEVE